MSDWRKAEGMVFLQEGKPLEPAMLKNAVKLGGFTPTWIEVRAAGILIKKNNALILHIEEIPQEFILAGAMPEEIEKFIDKKVVVTGNVQEEKTQLIISIKKFQVSR